MSDHHAHCCGHAHACDREKGGVDPGAVVTALCVGLLVVAAALDPATLINHHHAADTAHPSRLYLASALLGALWIWRGAWLGLRRGDFTADVPVALATAAALAVGEYAAASVVAALLLLGAYLEEVVAARAHRAVDALASLLPHEASVVADGQERQVPVDAVHPGDLVRVRAGERVPVDGKVSSGHALVSEAAITGESRSVQKSSEDALFAGTLVEDGALDVLTTTVGEDTTLGQIRRMVDEASKRRAPVERLLNRWSRVYTPAALAMALVLWLVSGNLLSAITMLIVFCPCVLVLATPTALVAAIGNGARRGILIKSGAAVEALARVDTVIFDKTGTLTEGRPRLAAIHALAGWDSATLLAFSASAEKLSGHPLARAVREEAQTRLGSIADPDSFENFPGLGVRAHVGGRVVDLGRQQWMRHQQIPLDDDLINQAGGLEREGFTVGFVSVDGLVAGLLAWEDRLRPRAHDTVRALQAQGVRVAIVSGDESAATDRLGTRLGVRDVHRGVLPAQKADIVRALQQEGRRVLFLGDGVNDSPALVTAQVGGAMGASGTDVAIESAQLALLSDELVKVPHALRLARHALAVVGHNLVFSLAVLAAAIVATWTGWLDPVTGALVHEISSLPVLANAARVIGFQEAGVPHAEAESEPVIPTRPPSPLAASGIS
ncbi:MAG: cation-translocating P-type ATPase [Armatimonadetes bacterium]|nr:cation-translocating P-type ATPase [Armatimonadota bacterium]